MRYRDPANILTLALMAIILLTQAAHPASSGAAVVRRGAGLIGAVRPQSTDGALAFGGVDSYVTFGRAPELGLAQFTIEAWFRRDGAGQTAYTGDGGLEAEPLVTKGRGEADGGNFDMNYFLGIDPAAGVLAADFEDTASGANHPIKGVTRLRLKTWYHAAATYDGRTWRLYLNGLLEAETIVKKAARSDSIQHAAIGSALDSTGAPEGFLNGAIDEVRIWNYARPTQQIADGMRQQLTGGAGLVARWGMNEGAGTAVSNSTGAASGGTILGANWSWAGGVAFASNRPPAAPIPANVTHGATGVSTSPSLAVTVSDPDNNNLIVTWYGRVAGKSGPDFTIIALPDTQYYTSAQNGGSQEMFTAQTQWIVNNRVAKNIAYVAQLGDVVDHGEQQPNGSRPTQRSSCSKTPRRRNSPTASPTASLSAITTKLRTATRMANPQSSTIASSGRRASAPARITAGILMAVKTTTTSSSARAA